MICKFGATIMTTVNDEIGSYSLPVAVINLGIRSTLYSRDCPIHIKGYTNEGPIHCINIFTKFWGRLCIPFELLV